MLRWQVCWWQVLWRHTSGEEPLASVTVDLEGGENGHGDMATWRHGDMETWRHGDMETPSMAEHSPENALSDSVPVALCEFISTSSGTSAGGAGGGGGGEREERSALSMGPKSRASTATISTHATMSKGKKR